MSRMHATTAGLAATLVIAHTTAAAEDPAATGERIDQFGQMIPSLGFALSFVAAEIFLFLFAVIVLSLSLVMFARLYPSLTPPTKTLAWVVTANLLLALLFLIFSFDQLHYFVQGKYVSPDDAVCHNMFSLARALILFTWLGQPIMAWVTFRTITSRPVSEHSIKTRLVAIAGLAFLLLLWNQNTAPGVIIMGVFCAHPPPFHRASTPPSSLPPSSSPLHKLPLLLQEMLGLGTLLLSVYWYGKSWWVLRAYERERRRRRRREGGRKGRKKRGRDGWWGWWKRGKEEEEEVGKEEEKEQEEEEGVQRRKQDDKWVGEEGREERSVADMDLEQASLPRSATPSLLSSSSGPSALPVHVAGKEGEEGGREEEEEREEDLYSIAAMQERTRAAQRAAVLMLLPLSAGQGGRGREGGREGGLGGGDGNRPSLVSRAMEDVEAGGGEREGGKEGGGGGGQFLSVEQEMPRGWMVGREGGREGGLDLMEEYARRSQRAAEVEASRAATRRRKLLTTSATAATAAAAAATVTTAKGNDDAKAEAVAQLLHAAARTLLHRALTLLCIYYVPFLLRLTALITLRYGPPPPGVAFFFFLFYTVGSPVMQAAVLVGVAVGIGRNIRRYGRREEEEEEGGGGEEEEEEELVRLEVGGEKEEEGVLGREEGGKKGLFMYELGRSEGRGGGEGEGRKGEGAAAGREGALSPFSRSSSSSDDKSSSGTSSGGSGGGSGSGGEDTALPPRSGGGREGGRGRRRRSSRKGGVGGRNVSEQMQALSTIYEVAFKKKVSTTVSSVGSGSAAATGGGGGGGGGGRRGGEGEPVPSSAVRLGSEEGGGSGDGARAEGGGGARKAIGGVVLMDGVGGEDALVPEALNLARRSSPSLGASGAVPSSSWSIPLSLPSSLPPSGLATPLHPLTAAAVGQLGSPFGYGGGGEGGRHTHGMISEISSLTDALDYASASGEGRRKGGRGGGRGSLGLGMWRIGREGGREAELEEDHDHVLDRSDVHSEEMNEREKKGEEEREEEEGSKDEGRRGVEANGGDDKQREERLLEAEQRGGGEEREGISSEEASAVSSAGRSIVTDSEWQAVLARTPDKKG